MKLHEMIRQLRPFLRDFRGPLFIAFTMAILSVTLNLYAPLFISDIIDAMSQGQPQAIILPSLMRLAMIYLAYSLCTWGMMLCTNHIAFSSAHTLRQRLFQKLEELPIAYYDTHEHGDMLARFTNDIDRISDGLLQGLSTLLSGLVTIILAIGFMVRIHIGMTCIVLLCAPFTYLIAKLITKRSHKYFIAQTHDIGKLNAQTQEMLAGIRTVKAYQQEDAAYERFQTLNQQLYHSGQHAQFYGSLVNPTTRLVTNSAYTIVGVCGAFFALGGQITLGNISSFLLYSNHFSKPFNEISAVMTQLQAAAASAQRILSLFAQPPQSDAGERTLRNCKGHIRFEHVSFGYDPHHLLMKDLCVDIPAGSRIAIVGKTGAGKTTLINLLMRFYEVNSGRILVDGMDITTCTRDELRSHFGMVLQDTFLGKDTIHNILAYGKKDANRSDIIQAAQACGAHSFIEKLSDGYDTVLNDNMFLSQGQRQLLSITRVMVMDPAILLLDEATSNIDTRSEVYVNAAMEKLMQGKTSFVIAHRLSTILNSDQILVMDQGNIVESGTHEQLLQKNGAYAALYHAQFEQDQT